MEGKAMSEPFKTDVGSSITSAMESAFVSPNESDSNMEPANVVDGLFAIARALHRVAKAIEEMPSNSND
jgi:hypothetical protein